MKLTETLLKKMSKAELIEFILENQKQIVNIPKETINESNTKSQPVKNKNTSDVVIIDYDDVPPDGGWKAGTEPTRRRGSTDVVYKCSRCSSDFKAPPGMYVKDRNEPICNRCLGGRTK